MFLGGLGRQGSTKNFCKVFISLFHEYANTKLEFLYINLIKIKVRKGLILALNVRCSVTMYCRTGISTGTYNRNFRVYPVFIVLWIYNFALLQNGIRQREGSCSSVWFLSWFSQENKRKS